MLAGFPYCFACINSIEMLMILLGKEMLLIHDVADCFVKKDDSLTVEFNCVDFGLW